MKRVDIENLIIDLGKYYETRKDDSYYKMLLDNNWVELVIEDETVIVSREEAIKLQFKSIRESEQEYIVKLNQQIKQMKNVMNCKYGGINNGYPDCKLSKSSECENCDSWELESFNAFCKGDD